MSVLTSVLVGGIAAGYPVASALQLNAPIGRRALGIIAGVTAFGAVVGGAINPAMPERPAQTATQSTNVDIPDMP